MEQKICLDTDVCIEILKGKYSVKSLQNKYPDVDIFISAITFFELFTRETQTDYIEEFVQVFELLNFDRFSALKASDIFKDLRKKGLIIGHRDIFIASACIVNDCSLLTLNIKHFKNIKGLNLIKVE